MVENQRSKKIENFIFIALHVENLSQKFIKNHENNLARKNFNFTFSNKSNISINIRTSPPSINFNITPVHIHNIATLTLH